MTQVTWRADDELVRHVQATASREGVSMNELITRVMRIATSVDDQAPVAVRLRERLRAAGVLATWESPPGPAPSAAEIERARAAAGNGMSLADTVADDRE